MAARSVMKLIALLFSLANSIYFQPQVQNHCAVHAVNNLLGYEAVDVETFRMVAEELHQQEIDLYGSAAVTDSNPYLSSVGFDVTTIIAVLALRKYEVSYSVELSNRENFLGLIVNVGQHWICIRLIGDRFYKIDSVSGITAFTDKGAVESFLKSYKSNCLAVTRSQNPTTGTTSAQTTASTSVQKKPDVTNPPRPSSGDKSMKSGTRKSTSKTPSPSRSDDNSGITKPTSEPPSPSTSDKAMKSGTNEPPSPSSVDTDTTIPPTPVSKSTGYAVPVVVLVVSILAVYL